MESTRSTIQLSQVIDSETESPPYQYRSKQQIDCNSTDESPVEDLICVGFGPASLAIAIALHEADLSHLSRKPIVSFLERQSEFAWHAGMQIPDAKMQISFLKDLATPRNPQSAFTFLTYLFAQNRLNHFINLSTFTPSRCEYEDYLRWCAAHFERQGLVTYGQEVLKVLPATTSPSGKITSFRVISRSMQTGALTTRLARHVVVAVGGEGQLPAAFASGHAAIVHSSQYFSKVSTALPTPSAPYTIAVIGNGQSAAEIFNDLLSRYPNARIVLAIKGSALRPSDDSPFVNEIFDADRVDGVFAKPAPLRAKALLADRATNYGVVRLELIEHLYEKLYMQRLRTKAEDWKLAIKTHRRVVAAVPEGAKLRLEMQQVLDDGSEGEDREELTVDAVFVATGYVRNAHERMLEELAGLVPKEFRSEGKGGKFPVGRDYKVLLDGKRVDDSAGIWLQGCNEGTHGLSDTLLSIIALRSGDLVSSMFGDAATTTTPTTTAATAAATHEIRAKL